MRKPFIKNGNLILRQGDIAFKDDKIYYRVNHSINFSDMHDSDGSVNKSDVNKIIIQTIPYVIRTNDLKYHIGNTRTLHVDSLPKDIYHITCTNIRSKINEYLHLLKKDDIYVEIGVKYGFTADSVLRYSKDNNLNISINLFEKDPYCCELLHQRFKEEVNIFQGNAEQQLNNLNNKIDFVFFDAHHHYENDYPILQVLIPYLKESSVIVFDDYTYSEDVRVLVEEFKTKYNFKNIYVI